MEILIIQKEAFEEMAAKFSRFAERVDALLAKQGGKSLNRWMDNQEVCQQLNISPRTLQTLRDNGTLAYSQINHKVFYKPEDVLSIVKLIEGKRTDRVVWLFFSLHKNQPGQEGKVKQQTTAGGPRGRHA